jgi:peptide deformylase
MISHGGIGLAANQIGLPYRAFAMASNPILVVFNPLIVDQTSDSIELEEACLSFPNMILKIKRPSIIRVRYTLPNGITETHKFIGITSRIFQHEIDHLNGVLFTDHVGPVSLAMAKAKANKRMKHKNE